MQKRTQYGLAALALVAAGGAAWFALRRGATPLSAGALDAIPSGALLVATADLAALRASPVGAPFLREGREIKGVGKIRDVCGFDPIDVLTEVAVAIPAAGESGDFGLAAAGPVDDEALLTCAGKVIEARGGRPVVTRIGSFRTVRDASLPAGGEIGVRPGGPILLGGGDYFRAMIDSADGLSATIRTSVAHNELARHVGEGAVRVTVVLTPEQRSVIAEELAQGAAPSPAIVAGGVGLQLGAEIGVHAVIACATGADCALLGDRLRAARDARVDDYATRLVGFASVLERVSFQPQGDLLHLRVAVAAEEAGVLVDRLATLRGFRHPMPDSTFGAPGRLTAPSAPNPEPLPPVEGLDALPDAAAPPPPGEVVTPPKAGDDGPEKKKKPRDGGT